MAENKTKDKGIEDLTSLLDDVMEDVETKPKPKPNPNPKPRKPSSTDKDFIFLEGLTVKEKVDPPEGFEEASSLSGTLAFLGGRKHDKADNLVAIVKKKDGTWHYVGCGIENMLDTPKLREWLSKL